MRVNVPSWLRFTRDFYNFNKISFMVYKLYISYLYYISYIFMDAIIIYYYRYFNYYQGVLYFLLIIPINSIHFKQFFPKKLKYKLCKKK